MEWGSSTWRGVGQKVWCVPPLSFFSLCGALPSKSSKSPGTFCRCRTCNILGEDRKKPSNNPGNSERKRQGTRGEGLARVWESGNFSAGEGKQAVQRSYSGLSSVSEAPSLWVLGIHQGGDIATGAGRNRILIRVSLCQSPGCYLGQGGNPWSATNWGLRDGGSSKSKRISEEKGRCPAFSGLPSCSPALCTRAKKAGKRPISGKGGQTPLKPPFVAPPFAAVQNPGEKQTFWQDILTELPGYHGIPGHPQSWALNGDILKEIQKEKHTNINQGCYVFFLPPWFCQIIPAFWT